MQENYHELTTKKKENIKPLEIDASLVIEKDPSKEVQNLANEIEEKTYEFETKTEQGVVGGLDSLKSTDPATRTQGKNLVDVFKQKAENLKNVFSNRLNTMMLALGLITPAVIEAAPEIKKKQEEEKNIIYTTDPNDPRLKAYQDSAALYNNYIEVTKELKDQEYSEYKPKDGLLTPVFDQFDLTRTKRTYEDYVKKVSSPTSRVKPKDIDVNMHSIPDFIQGIINPTLPEQKYHDVIKPVGMQWFSFTGTPTSPDDPRVEGRLVNRDHRVVANYENVKTVQTIIYKPEEVIKQDTVIKKEMKRIPEKVLFMEPKKPDLLTGYSEKLATKINKIPFKKGTYFTHRRDRQPQESGSAQFGREVLIDFFDNKTGKLLGTYPESYLDDK